MSRVVAAGLLGLGLLGGPGPAGGTSLYRGRVVDGSTGQPVAGAVVLIVWDEVREDSHVERAAVREAVTNPLGEYLIDGTDLARRRARVLPPRMLIWKPGYAPLPDHTGRPAGGPVQPVETDLRLVPATTEQARIEAFNTYVHALSGFNLRSEGPPETTRVLLEELARFGVTPEALRSGPRR